MEKTPQFFTRTGKLPTEAKLASMKENVMASSDNSNQQSKAKDKPMTNKNGTVETNDNRTKPRKRLTPEQVAKMIKEWDDKSISEWAKEFDVSYQTVVKMSEAVNKQDASLCKKKEAVKVKKEDIAKAAIELFKKGKVKK